jgi:hypothetical protein
MIVAATDTSKSESEPVVARACLLNADPAEREEVSRRFRRERERLASERDAKVEKIRRGEGDT